MKLDHIGFTLRGFRTCAALGLALLAGGLTACAQRYYAPRYNSYQPRRESPVDRTAQHLEMLAHRTAAFDSGHERGRYDDAIRHLSQFQNDLYRGHFDRGKLDQAIGDVQNVLKHNPLDDRARGMLWNDLNDLRAFRATGEYVR